MQQSKVITIIGGNGEMGSLFSRLWQSLGHKIRILDKNDWHNAKQLMNNCDLAIISVPINLTQDIIIKLVPFLSATTILADLTSIKQQPLKLMRKHHSGVILGLHPLFGPTITKNNGQVIINCGGRYPNQAKWVIDSFKQLGFTIINMQAKQHDKYMDFIQGLEHFITYTIGTFLHQHNIHPQKLSAIASPIYYTKLALIGRIFDQDPQLYADIIMSDKQRTKLLTQYSQWLLKCLKEVQQNNTSSFIDHFKQTHQWMGNFTHDSQIASDSYLELIQASKNNKENS